MTLAPCVLALLLIALGGCGSDDEEAQTGAQRPATAEDVLRGAQEAMRGVESFHVEGVQRDEEGTIRIAGDVGRGGRARLRFEQRGVEVDIILVGEAVFLRGDAAFWSRSEAPPRVARLLADRWVKAPADEEIEEISEQLQPGTVAHCLGVDAGTLRVEERRSFRGRDVVVLSDAGDKPGSTPGELYVAAGDPAYPLRLRQTGPRRSGGSADPRCDEDEEDAATRSDLVLSQFDEEFEIDAPEGALDLQEVARGGGETTV